MEIFQIKSGLSLGKETFCLIDIETTGLSTAFHEITEISAIRVNNRFEAIAEISHLVRISGSVPWHITRLTGIDDRLLRTKGLPLRRALEEIADFVSGQTGFAHHASFDRRFLNDSCLRETLSHQFPLECTIPHFKRAYPGRRTYKLQEIARDLGVAGGGAHRGLQDCRVLLGCLARAFSPTLPQILIRTDPRPSRPPS